MTTQSLERNASPLNQQTENYLAPTRKESRPLFVLSLQAVIALLLALGTVLSPTPAAAGNDLSNGYPTQLTLPAGCPGAPGCGSDAAGVFPTITQGPPNFFTGKWTLDDPAYGQGFFQGTGPYPDKGGTNTFDFSRLGPLGQSSLGFLPAGTMVYFGDLDNGSGPESFMLRGVDRNGNPLGGPVGWLNDAFYVSGSDPGDLIQANLPEYTYNSGDYVFDGHNVPGNPTIGVWLTTNQDIGWLEVTSDTQFASFGIAAPAPEPSSLLLLGSGIVGLGGLLRRRLIG